MDWPLFPERYPIAPLHGTPFYWDALILLLMCFIGVAGFLVTHLGRKGTAHTLQLVTLRPHNIVSISEYRIPLHHYGMGLLLALFQISLLILFVLDDTGHNTHSSSSSSPPDFWLSLLVLTGLVTVFQGIRLALDYWIARTFSDKRASYLWLTNEVILFILFGTSLLVPVLLLLFPNLPLIVPITLTGLLYLIFRVWCIHRGLNIIPKLRQAPLLIILYLCACEVAPLYLAYSFVIFGL